MQIRTADFLSLLKSAACSITETDEYKFGLYFHFNGKHVWSFNGVTLTRLVLPAEYASLTGLVLAKPLLSLLDKLSSEFVELEIKKEQMLLSTGAIKVKLPITVLEEAELDVTSMKFQLEPLPADFIENLTKVSAYCSPSIPILDQVYWNKSMLLSSDSYQVAIARLKDPTDIQLLLPSNVAANITQLKLTHFGFKQTWICFSDKTGSQQMYYRLVSGDYPEAHTLLQGKGVKIQLDSELKNSVSRIIPLLSDSLDREQLISVNIESKTLTIKGESEHGSYCETLKLKEAVSKPISFEIRPAAFMNILSLESNVYFNEQMIFVRSSSFFFAISLQ